MRLKSLAAALILSSSLTPVFADAPATPSVTGVPVSELVKRVDIPYDQFTLPNGLRVVVHSDHKAPVVAVAMWYHIGSKDEPKGRSGFAHLFEHLMFAGAEHAKGSVIEQMQALGATDLNGTTYFDRTNYFETVPVGALDRALFIESDRMGYLLAAVPQSQLDVQRGVVQNEKRGDDNQPLGMVEYAQLENLFPAGHPYHHTTIGSMSDLDKASLTDVRNWFHDHYAPNNATLVLAGDIDLATAKAKAMRWFGELKRGPAVIHPPAPVPTLAAPKTIQMKDRIAAVHIIRDWAIPGEASKDSVPLDLAASVLGGLASSRFDNVLVRTKQVALNASASAEALEKVGIFEISMDVKPGVDPNLAGRMLDDVVAQFLHDGPRADELNRAATREVETTITGLESFSGKAAVLGAGETYENDPGFFKKQLEQVAAATPDEVHAVAKRWLSRPALTIIVTPGERDPYTEATPHHITPAADAPLPPSVASDDRVTPPKVDQPSSLTFPAIERTTLSNGMHVTFAHRAAVPTIQVSLSFDAGFAADSTDKLGEQSMMLSLLTEGTTSRDARKIAEDSEALGAHVGTSASMDRTAVTLAALTPNLAPSLDLLADVALHPAFTPADVERVRAQHLAEIDAAAKGPSEPARKALSEALWGPDHPYGRPSTGLGNADVVNALTREDLVKDYQTWLRPDNAQIFVVGDTDLATIKPLLEARFGTWAAPATPLPAKNFSVTPPSAQPRIILIDRPNAPQSYIVAGHVLNATGHDNLFTLRAANEVLSNGFASRIYHDLREVKSWAYGTRGAIGNNEHQIDFTLAAPVQADRTGDSIKEILSLSDHFLKDQGTTDAERNRIVETDVRALPGEFETAGAVMGALQNIVLLGRPDDYYTTLPAKYQALTTAAMDAAARANLDAGKLVFVVVGDVAKVKPQLDALGLPVVGK